SAQNSHARHIVFLPFQLVGECGLLSHLIEELCEFLVGELSQVAHGDENDEALNFLAGKEGRKSPLRFQLNVELSAAISAHCRPRSLLARCAKCARGLSASRECPLSLCR